MGYIGVISLPLILTIDPNFLGHPSVFLKELQLCGGKIFFPKTAWYREKPNSERAGWKMAGAWMKM